MKIKHLLTQKCHVNCEYCLEKNVKTRQVNSALIIMDVYKKLYDKGYTTLDITGGEPTMHPNYIDIALVAANVFDEVHLYTADWNEYNREFVEEAFTTVNYGWHQKLVTLNQLEKVNVGIPVYMQTMNYHYNIHLPWVASALGFSGLSINTDKHLKESTFDHTLPEIEGFSIRINDNDCCAHTTLLMPDLSIVDDVGQYLDKNLTS
jgi:hypothetical protein